MRYAETDQMRVAHHANYFVWFEAARSEYCRRYSVDYSALEASGYAMPVVEARCRYLQPARYDDELIVTVRAADVSSRILRFEYTVLRGADKLAAGETRQVLVDRSGRSVPFPLELRALFAPANQRGPNHDAGG